MGGVRSQWVERGRVRSKWGEKGGEVVKKAESAGQMVKKGGASSRIGRLAIQSQTERADRTEDRNDGQKPRVGIMSRNDKQE